MTARPRLILVGLTEIAQRAGVNVDTVQKWRLRYPDEFPRPILPRPSGPVWVWGEVEAWLLQTGRLRAEDKGSFDG